MRYVAYVSLFALMATSASAKLLEDECASASLPGDVKEVQCKISFSMQCDAQAESCPTFADWRVLGEGRVQYVFDVATGRFQRDFPMSYAANRCGLSGRIKIMFGNENTRGQIVVEPTLSGVENVSFLIGIDRSGKMQVGTCEITKR